jgi:branched-chain amino acid transport system ATP-binding protein
VALLRLEGLHSYYGAAYVLQGVSLDCADGEAVALLGRNGQGKTTVLKSIVSMLVPRRGRVTFQGTDVTGWPSHAIARLGISLVPEGRRIFPALSVLDHLRVPVGSGGVTRAEQLRFVLQVFPELKEKLPDSARGMSGGQQQLLVIARALMTRPKLLLLDEPMEGLSPKAVKRVIEALKLIQRAGVTLLFASTSCERAFLVANRAYIIEKGRIVHQAARDELLGNLEVQRHYLGVRG